MQAACVEHVGARVESVTNLRREGELWKGDARRGGPNEAQAAIDALLSVWAERTWNVTTSRGETFAMRVAKNLAASGGADDPQADWKRDANGKEKRVRTQGRGTQTEHILGVISGKLLMEEPRQYALLCLHYGAFQYVDTVHWPTHKKAAYLGIQEATYRNRLTKLRNYFIAHWPQSALLK